MDKQKYLNELEKRLTYLNEEQKQQEIFRVSNELDNGSVMNDLSVEVDNIYKKYNINVEKKINHENNEFFKKIDSVSNKLKNIFKKMKKNNWKDNATIIRDFIIIILIVSVLKIPFEGVEILLFKIFGTAINDKIYTIINFFIELIYLIFAIYMFVRIFKRRFKKEME